MWCPLAALIVQVVARQLVARQVVARQLVARHLGDVVPARRVDRAVRPAPVHLRRVGLG